MNIRTCRPLAAGVSLWVGAISADPATNLETVEVTAQALPLAITTLTARDLRPVRDTGDALRDLLGVGGSRMGGHGIDPAIRGQAQTQLNVLLDGAYIHGACPNRMDPPTAYAGASAWQEVTVIRGTQTLEHGGGGPGGTILFERRTQALATGEYYRGEINGFYRDNDRAAEVGADLTLGQGSNFVRLLGGHTEADDYADGSGDKVRSSYRETSGGLIIGYQLNDTAQLELSHDYQLTADALFPGAGMDSPSAESNTTRLKYRAEGIGPLETLRVDAYQANVDHTMDNYTLRDNVGMRLRAPSSSDTIGGRIVATWVEVDRQWKAGLDHQDNRREARRWNDSSGSPALNSVLWPDVAIRQTGFFIEMAQPLSSGVTLHSGLRYDRATAAASETALDPVGMPLSPEALYASYYGDVNLAKRTDHNLSGLIRVEGVSDDGRAGWYAGAAQVMRNPDATERFLASNGPNPSARWVGNPDLEPERHRQLEVGLIRRWGRVEVDVSLYHNQVDDYVLRDRAIQAGDNAAIYRNVEAQLSGGEARITWRPAAAWAVQLGGAYVYAQNETDDRAIAQIQPLEGFARVDWQQDRWEIGVSLQAQARQNRVDLTSASGISGQGLDVRRTPGWSVLNLTASYRLRDDWLLQMGIDNALDRDYSQHLNRANAFDPTQIQVDEPGRSIWLGLRAQL